MPIRQKRLKLIHKLSETSSGIYDLPTLPHTSTEEVKNALNLCIKKIQQDSRVTQSVLTMNHPNAVTKEEATIIENDYDDVLAKCEELLNQISAFYQLTSKNTQEWNAHIKTPLASLEQSLDKALQNAEDRASFHESIKTSNALLLIHRLTSKIIENKSINHRDIEGMLREPGSQTTVDQVLKNLQRIFKADNASNEQRSPGITGWIWNSITPSIPTAPKKLTLDDIDHALSNAAGHDFSGILKKIMLKPDVIGIQKPNLSTELKQSLLAIAQTLHTRYTTECACLSRETQTQPKEIINQLSLEAVLNESSHHTQAQDALMALIEELPACYINILSTLINMMATITHPEVNNKMNAANVGLAMPGIFEMMGLFDELPNECSADNMKTYKTEMECLAVLTSCWVQTHIESQQILSKALTQKYKAGDKSDIIHEHSTQIMQNHKR